MGYFEEDTSLPEILGRSFYQRPPIIVGPFVVEVRTTTSDTRSGVV